MNKPAISPKPGPKPGHDTSTELAGRLIEGGHTMQVRVYYEDTDFTGIVYHANYLRFMERGRTNYLRLVGADHRALFERTEEEAPSFAFVVRSMKIDYLRPAYMDDLLEIRTLSREVSGASIILRQKVMRGQEVMVEAEVRVAFVSEGRPRRIPESLRAAMGADAERNPER